MTFPSSSRCQPPRFKAQQECGNKGGQPHLMPSRQESYITPLLLTHSPDFPLALFGSLCVVSMKDAPRGSHQVVVLGTAFHDRAFSTPRQGLQIDLGGYSRD